MTLVNQKLTHFKTMSYLQGGNMILLYLKLRQSTLKYLKVPKSILKYDEVSIRCSTHQAVRYGTIVCFITCPLLYSVILKISFNTLTELKLWLNFVNYCFHLGHESQCNLVRKLIAVHPIFLVRKAYFGKIMFFYKLWSKVTEIDESESVICCSNLHSTNSWEGRIFPENNDFC